MSLVFPAVHDARPEADTREPVALLASSHWHHAAAAAYEDAELLLTSILPDARIEHVGATAVAGALSPGGVDVCVAVPRDAFTKPWACSSRPAACNANRTKPWSATPRSRCPMPRCPSRCG